MIEIKVNGQDSNPFMGPGCKCRCQGLGELGAWMEGDQFGCTCWCTDGFYTYDYSAEISD